MKPLTDSVVVAYNVQPGGNGVLIVGRKSKGEVIKVINAFEGDEAREIYNRLVSRKNG